MGDFNSDVYGVDPTGVTPTYGMVRAAGYRDSWVEPDSDAIGLTCCQRPDLLNPRPAFDQRLDFVFNRNLPEDAEPEVRAVVGDRLGDRTAAELWPSDHAGVVIGFRAPQVSVARAQD